MGFFKSPWWKDLKRGIVLYLIVSISASLIIQFGLFPLIPIQYSILLSLVWFLIFSNIILLGFLCMSATLPFIKSIYNIVYLNDCNYKTKFKMIKIPIITITLPLYLVIIYINVMTTLQGFHPILILLISWLILIIVRLSHYADKKIGTITGEILGTFFLIFGIIYLAVFINDFLQSPTLDLVSMIILICYFIIILIAQYVLEIIADYYSNKGKDLMNTKIEFLEEYSKYKIIQLIILLFLVFFILLTSYFIYIKDTLGVILGSLSLIIAFISISLSNSSERRMKLITRSSYNLLFADFNFNRLEIRKKMNRIDLLFNIPNVPYNIINFEMTNFLIEYYYSIWTCNRFLKSFLDLQEHLENYQQLEIIHQIDNYLIDFGMIKYENSLKTLSNYREQIEQIVNSISTFNVFYQNEKRADRIAHNMLYLLDDGPDYYQDYE